MAVANPVQALQDEITCTICLDYFKDPMMITGCGHNFCQACITRYWKSSCRNVSCPQCRKTFPRATLKQNRQLRNVVEVTRQLSLQSPPKPVLPENLCDLHKEPLKLFCLKDCAPICVVCDRAKGHRDHTVIPIEEAVQEQKDQILSRVQNLKKQKDAAEEFKKKAEMASQDLLERTGVESQKLVAEVEQFCQALKDQMQFLLSHLKELQIDILKNQYKNISKYTKEITELNGLISDIERVYDQPETVFLKEVTQLNSLISKKERVYDQQRDEFLQEFRSILDSFDEEQFEENSLGDLGNRFEKISEQTIIVKETLQKHKDEMANELMKAMDEEALKPYAKADVILDCDTAHTLLVLSEGQRSVRWDIELWEEMPDHPKRFMKHSCVLGSEGFTSGRFYWEIDVEEGETWAVGVARESVERESTVYFAPENGIWGVGLDEGFHVAFCNSGSTRLSLSEPLRRIQVYLDYAAGQVSFFNVDSNTLIFTFPPATFCGEKVYPWFWIECGLIRLCWTEEENEQEYLASGMALPWELYKLEGFSFAW